MNIVIIDYGMGNLKNVQNAFNYLGFDAKITGDYGDIGHASHLILPGVGGFKDAMLTLKQKGLVEPIKAAISGGKHFLGICLGMQLLFETSEEFGQSEGLAVLKGKVVKFNEDNTPLIPHIGWNDIEILKQASEFNGIKNNAFFYFLHSYYCVPDEDITVATCSYYERFAACVKKNNIFACQFHPEKSHIGGLTLLKNFINN
ncbi:MAG: imidazole glycerol phosphate synthase subunit HisH [Deltaproteobacteria bacterium]|jgi:glutamine amidotransferase|nr:imidazole glycerol phosphate synthase subunit HisH [Deltaproteobacteria bacterium]MCL5879859.1 imidazole glycerol phosphate synthase subunit HisH [Deltaproteobacteria bacterium]MDA8303858.1 imidazole glycerol phosphate synthase subunit HisH [Deltaproteobacteria bacterium]